MVKGWEYLGLLVRLQPHARSGYGWLRIVATASCEAILPWTTITSSAVAMYVSDPHTPIPRCELRVSDEKRPILMLGLDGDVEGAQVK